MAEKHSVSGKASDANKAMESMPPYYPAESVKVHGFYFWLRVTWARFAQSAIFRIAGLFQSSEGKGRIYEKAYPNQPHLKHRFIPPPKPSTDLPPLILDIHGGGFIIGNPWNDDEQNLRMSSNLNCFVVSMNYSKTPNVRFPTPIDELVNAVLDVLADTSLRFDRSRVVICGYSAGGNLCLSVAQSPLLKDKLRGVVSWYPATDGTISPDDKARSRPYPPGASADQLRADYDYIVKAYVPREAVMDPRFSVTFAPRETLPPELLIVGAELDLLCKEAGVMAGKYAGIDMESIWDTDAEQKFGFEAKGIRWICVRGALHGFTHAIGNFGAEGQKRTQITRDHYAEVCRWLSEVPFSIREPATGTDA